jgi:hypothetical protein
VATLDENLFRSVYSRDKAARKPSRGLKNHKKIGPVLFNKYFENWSVRILNFDRNCKKIRNILVKKHHEKNHLSTVKNCEIKKKRNNNNNN